VHFEAPIAGIPATGKHVSIKGSDVYKIEGKKILEWWEFNDMLGLMTLIGDVTSTAPNK
jgi:predicted ester cyclase